MSKFFRWTGYVSTAIGFVLIVLGVVGHICHRFCNAAACSMQHPCSCMQHPGLFGAAISFLVLAITLFIISDLCCSSGCHDHKGAADAGKKENVDAGMIMGMNMNMNIRKKINNFLA